MSLFHNNNLLHNLRVGVLMINKGMDPDVASFALAKECIIAPAELLAAAAKPGVLESMSSKPYTHARANQQIAAYMSMKRTCRNSRNHQSRSKMLSMMRGNNYRL